MSAQITSKNPGRSAGAASRTQHIRVLEEHLRKQVELSQACGRRAVAAGDRRLRSAWIGAFVQRGDAVAETVLAIADLKWASDNDVLALPIHLRLPVLPALPDEGEAPLPDSGKQPPAEKAVEITA